MISAPGTVHGPCSGECDHDACHDKRATARKLCAVCTRPLGWDTAIIDDDPSRAAHAKCMTQVEGLPDSPVKIGDIITLSAVVVAGPHPSGGYWCHLLSNAGAQQLAQRRQPWGGTVADALLISRDSIRELAGLEPAKPEGLSA